MKKTTDIQEETAKARLPAPERSDGGQVSEVPKVSKEEDKKEEVLQVPEVPREAKEEYKEKYLRALADYQNLVKRTQAEREEFVQFASEVLIKKLLSALDNLERAKGVLTDKGIDIIYNELWQVLQSEGVERIKFNKTDAFDPMTMECIEACQEGNLLQEVRAGYTLKGKVIRAVHVKAVK